MITKDDLIEFLAEKGIDDVGISAINNIVFIEHNKDSKSEDVRFSPSAIRDGILAYWKTIANAKPKNLSQMKKTRR